jgi:hypothetical protein
VFSAASLRFGTEPHNVPIRILNVQLKGVVCVRQAGADGDVVGDEVTVVFDL